MLTQVSDRSPKYLLQHLQFAMWKAEAWSQVGTFPGRFDREAATAATAATAAVSWTFTGLRSATKQPTMFWYQRLKDQEIIIYPKA